MTKYEYAVFANTRTLGYSPSDADWYPTITEAITAAREYIADGTKAEDVEVLKFNIFTDSVAWTAPITFDEDGNAWSESTGAREEMGFIQGQF